MCIAILNTKGTIADKSIKNSWDNNNQGGGLLYHRDNKLHTFKTYEYKDFLNEYKRVKKDSRVNSVVLHFRIATSGHEKYTNLHPFMVNDDLGFVHNGIISGLGDKQYSDTYHFNTILKGLPYNFLDNASVKEFIRDYISGSKLIFLDANNNHTIINEKAGEWVDGNWYSNDSYKKSNDFVWYGNVKKEKETIWNWDFEDSAPSIDDDVQKFCDLTGEDVSSKHIKDDIEYYKTIYGAKDLQDLNNKLEDEIYY